MRRSWCALLLASTTGTRADVPGFIPALQADRSEPGLVKFSTAEYQGSGTTLLRETALGRALLDILRMTAAWRFGAVVSTGVEPVLEGRLQGEPLETAGRRPVPPANTGQGRTTLGHAWRADLTTRAPKIVFGSTSSSLEVGRLPAVLELFSLQSPHLKPVRRPHVRCSSSGGPPLSPSARTIADPFVPAAGLRACRPYSSAFERRDSLILRGTETPSHRGCTPTGVGPPRPGSLGHAW